MTAETGLKVKAISPKQAIEEMAAAMEQLAQNPELKNRMGEAGRERVREIFAWDKKGEWLRDLSARIERVDARAALVKESRMPGNQAIKRVAGICGLRLAWIRCFPVSTGSPGSGGAYPRGSCVHETFDCEAWNCRPGAGAYRGFFAQL